MCAHPFRNKPGSPVCARGSRTELLGSVLFVRRHKSWSNGYAYRRWNLAEGVGVRDCGGDRGRGFIRRPLSRESGQDN
jgi:hypothetical protein